MFDAKHYVPVLKTKAGELDALEKLRPADKASFTPLLEIIPVPVTWPDPPAEPFPSKSIDDHVNHLSKAIADAWGSRSPLFVDGGYIEEEDVLNDGSEPIVGFLRALNSKGVNAIPVIGFNRLLEYNDACKEFATDHAVDLCLRLTPYDLDDAASLEIQTKQLLAYLGLTPARIHLVVDYASISPVLRGAMSVTLPFQIASIPYLKQWKTLTLTATAFPTDLAEVERNTTDVFARSEWEIWSMLHDGRHRLGRLPTFGDYTVTHPNLLILDPRVIRISPKIKYCDKLQWVVAKGEAFRRKKDPKPNIPPGVQYPLLSKLIMEHEAWCGSGFSWGDEFIANCANREVTGSAQNWVTVGTVHHIVFVLQQLASLPAT